MFIPIFSLYVNLEMDARFSDSSAIAESRRRLFTFLNRAVLKVSERNKIEKKMQLATACLLCYPNAPIQHFLTKGSLTKVDDLRIPSCYKKADAPSAQVIGQNNRDKFRLSFVPAASLTFASVPEKWSSSNAVDNNLLPVPTSPALHALLDLLRKLLAWSPNQGFADGDANNAVAAIDTVRFLLHRSDATALQKLKKKAANEGSSRCYEIADLALKQIEQRDSHKSQENAASPNADGVTAALEKCIKAANTGARKKGVVAAAAKGAVQRANSVTSRRLLPLQVPVPRSFEMLPFAIPSGGMWVAHRFTLECDVINGATGLGVWVAWRKGSKVKGMGYIKETFDQPPTPPTTTYTCSKRYLWSVKATSCKALKLLDATPRGALKPTEGFLKIFSKNGAPSNLIDAVENMAAGVCHSAKGDEALRQFKMDLVGAHEDRKVMGKAKGRRNTV